MQQTYGEYTIWGAMFRNGVAVFSFPILIGQTTVEKASPNRAAESCGEDRGVSMRSRPGTPSAAPMLSTTRANLLGSGSQ